MSADEQASAEFLDWLDDEAARGAELRELLRGPQRAPATELTEAELLQLAAADEAMELAPREKLELTKVRQKCGQLGRMVGLSPLESAMSPRPPYEVGLTCRCLRFGFAKSFDV